MDRLHMLLEVVLPLEPVGAYGADICFRTVRLLVHGRLVRGHDVRAEMMALQEALVTLVTAVWLDFGVNGEDVLGKVVLASELVRADGAFECLPLLMN